jgi:hypothetical protein
MDHANGQLGSGMLIATDVREYQHVRRSVGFLGPNDLNALLQRAEAAVRAVMWDPTVNQAHCPCPTSMREDLTHVLQIRGFRVISKNSAEDAGIYIVW